VLLNQGANNPGAFSVAHNYPTGHPNPVAIAIGDFNGDSSPDVVVADQAVVGADVFLNNGKGVFGKAISSPSNGGNVGSIINGLAIGDFNGDGALDAALTTSNGASHAVAVLVGNGDGTFQDTVPTFGVGTTPVGIVAADFDDNGSADSDGLNTPDLATANTADNTVSVLLNSSTGGTPLVAVPIAP